jgi:hypothetical protein
LVVSRETLRLLDRPLVVGAWQCSKIGTGEDKCMPPPPTGDMDDCPSVRCPSAVC